MLSVEACREILGDEGRSLNDDSVLCLRDNLYGLAAVVLDLVASGTISTPYEEALGLVPSTQREGIEERAAICEYDGKLSRSEAEMSAMDSYLRRVGHKNREGNS